MTRPNVLFLMTDQQRFDTIQALGNSRIRTPNLDRLVSRGVSFTNAYSTCPVCMPARLTLRTGREPALTGCHANGGATPAPGQPAGIEERCGAYLARTMSELGYRSFGVGKFHPIGGDFDLGYEVHGWSEELYGSEEGRSADGYAQFIRDEFPAFDFLEMPHGERSEMYYVPQMAATPPEATVEWWTAREAIREIKRADERPWFGMVSFVGPHPPCAPPQPFNRMYDPDAMPEQINSDRALDEIDRFIPWHRHLIWGDTIVESPLCQKIFRARYYGEISYIDQCIGAILDAVEARADADNTLICFVSDHGDFLGDHHAVQKESFLEQSAHIPFLLSWPAKLPRDVRHDELVCLTDCFAIATAAAGACEERDGIDVLGMLAGMRSPRQSLIGTYGKPGTDAFKAMVRHERWKYLWFSNGGHEVLFDLAADPNESCNLAEQHPQMLAQLRGELIQHCRAPTLVPALAGDQLLALPQQDRERRRHKQMARHLGVSDYPDDPSELLGAWVPISA